MTTSAETDAPKVGPLHRIPSLDGLRAISILLVLLGHASGTFSHTSRLSHALLLIFGNAELGVSVFFVISGFLITTLLVHELDRTGQIQLKHFYIRRIFRIWPAFYAYISVILLLKVFGILHLTWAEFASAALFLQNYGFLVIPAYSPNNWFIGHIWTLSVEEQFYLLWPLALLLLKRRRALLLALALLAVTPVVRVAEYLLVPFSREQIPIMLHTRADTLMFGCTAALLYHSPRFQAVLHRAFAWRLPLVSAVFVVFVSPVLAQKLRGVYVLPIGWSLEGASIVLVLLWTIQNVQSEVGRFLNAKPVVYVGVLSYSLYLWQQLFLTTQNTTFLGRFPLNLLICFAVAQVSYTLIEQPFLRLRRRVMP